MVPPSLDDKSTLTLYVNSPRLALAGWLCIGLPPYTLAGAAVTASGALRDSEGGKGAVGRIWGIDLDQLAGAWSGL